MNEPPPATLQLSLGGVAFTLIPSDPKGTVTFTQQQEQKEAILLQLTNFSGTLCVHSNAHDSVVATASKQTKITAINEITPKQRSLQDNIGNNKRARLEDSSSSSSSNGSSIEEVSNRFSNTNSNMLGQPDLSQTQATLSGDEELQQEGLLSTPEPVRELLQQQQQQSPDTKDLASVPPSRVNLTSSVSHPPIPARLSLGDDLLTTSHRPPPSNPPCPRWGHSMTCIGPNRILIYGGQTLSQDNQTPVTLDDLHIFNGTRWIQPLNNCNGMKRQWHTATYLPERQLLIAFGGEATTAKTSKPQVVHPVMVLDTEIMLWYPPSVSGDIPKGRSGHTATLLGHELVVWGGVSANKCLQRVSVLDTLRWVWHTPTIQGTAPRPRSYHTATACGQQRIVVFGGNDAEQSFNSVHVLERKNSSCWEWSNVQTTGTLPCPRTGHSAVLLQGGVTICIYGGWDPNGDEEDVMFDDSFLLNTETWVWTKGPSVRPWCAGEGKGAARVGHEAVLDGSRILVFGGRIPGDEFSNDLQTLDVSSLMSSSSKGSSE